ncbi:MAG: hypothetical protein LBU99_01090 [Spirochaetaceae bacterium]|jgi:processive 1,2-diacylglycerol beta-glucosyltransferase/1,2-diacylglycerol 3-beta-galactosyltransferase|nr:hypothetical protein [Spirochaetaceae bacterium]
MSEKVLFLYLDTGGGHKGSARIVAKELESQYGGELSVELLNGFSPKQRIARLFFEIGYRFACLYVPSIFSIVYDLNTLPPVLRFVNRLVTPRTTRFLARYIREHDITKVVSFHFVLAPPAVQAIRQVNPSIPFLVMVTDPFTIHPAWIFEQDQHFIVYSETAKKEIQKMSPIPAERITVMPFIVDRRFYQPSVSDISGLKEKYQTTDYEHTLLITGGGDGLKGMVQLVRYFLTQKARFGIIAVCGHDRYAKQQLEELAQRFPNAGLMVFGFVSFMDELIRISDCVVTKAGPLMIMEILACRKPLILSTYIHDQERGNVHYVTQNGLGWFLRTPALIYEKITRLFGDSDYEQRIRRNLENVSPPSGASELASFIKNFQGITSV